MSTKRKRVTARRTGKLSAQRVDDEGNQYISEVPTIELLDLLPSTSGSTSEKPKRKRKSGPRKLSLKAGLLKKLRAERRTLNKRLRQVERDLASLECKPKENGQ